MLLGKRVITPDNEQGFISCEYDCSIDVDILEDDAETAEHTTTINYKKEVIIPCQDQTPRLRDITPFGQVKMLGILADGLIEVVLGTGYSIKSTLWLSEKRLSKRPDDYDTEWGHWTPPKDFTMLLDHYDLYLNADGCIDPKPLIHEAIPYEAHLRVDFADKDTEFWNVRMGATAGEIEFVKTDTGEKLKTLAEVRATGATTTELQCHYSLEDF